MIEMTEGGQVVIMKKAFTLIKLLVVIAIIAILAAILFPVFAQANEASNKTSCLANVKQMGLATNIHSNDYDDQVFSFRFLDVNNPNPFESNPYLGSGACA
jgi:prepilin-type N-terminal cleavage/methylation domain-containing protein